MKATTSQIERAATFAADYFKLFSPELWGKGIFGRYEEPLIGNGVPDFGMRVFVERDTMSWVGFRFMDEDGDELGLMELSFTRGARFSGDDALVLLAMANGLAKVVRLRAYVPNEAWDWKRKQEEEAE